MQVTHFHRKKSFASQRISLRKAIAPFVETNFVRLSSHPVAVTAFPATTLKDFSHLPDQLKTLLERETLNDNWSVLRSFRSDVVLSKAAVSKYVLRRTFSIKVGEKTETLANFHIASRETSSGYDLLFSTEGTRDAMWKELFSTIFSGVARAIRDEVGQDVETSLVSSQGISLTLSSAKFEKKILKRALEKALYLIEKCAASANIQEICDTISKAQELKSRRQLMPGTHFKTNWIAAMETFGKGAQAALARALPSRSEADRQLLLETSQYYQAVNSLINFNRMPPELCTIVNTHKLDKFTWCIERRSKAGLWHKVGALFSKKLRNDFVLRKYIELSSRRDQIFLEIRSVEKAGVSEVHVVTSSPDNADLRVGVREHFERLFDAVRSIEPEVITELTAADTGCHVILNKRKGLGGSAYNATRWLITLIDFMQATYPLSKLHTVYHQTVNQMDRDREGFESQFTQSVAQIMSAAVTRVKQVLPADTAMKVKP